MKEFIYPEMMVHVGLCTSKLANDVLIISDNSELLSKEVARHGETNSTVVSSKLESIAHLDDNAYDVIICELDIDATVASQINRVLRDDGQLVSNHPSLDKVKENKNLMKFLGSYFKVIMPFNIGNGSTSLMCSKEYHPTADINLHRADMLDGLSYYNCDVHPAAFAMGNYVRKEYLGSIKN
ncbi:MAG: spermidine synthase [Sulfurimonas sp.]|nr:MAG: spermidine synthase [Sulfurimonas sp.]